ncbi:MAG: AI-2E family transporter, partial [Firmicutes bacterium]|nr:AI-2E family transporter [Bacillota bacterium]
ESLVITPKIMGDKVGLHPLTTVMAVLAGGLLFGIAGSILAVPVTAAGSLILSYLWSRIVGAKIT